MSSLEEAAECLSLNPDKLRRMARAKQIGHIKTGRRYLFPRAALESHVQNHTVEPMPVPMNRYMLSDSAYQRLLRQRRD